MAVGTIDKSVDQRLEGLLSQNEKVATKRMWRFRLEGWKLEDWKNRHRRCAQKRGREMLWRHY
jgi:hypothetical protein